MKALFAVAVLALTTGCTTFYDKVDSRIVEMEAKLLDIVKDDQESRLAIQTEIAETRGLVAETKVEHQAAIKDALSTAARISAELAGVPTAGLLAENIVRKETIEPSDMELIRQSVEEAEDAGVLPEGSGETALIVIGALVAAYGGRQGYKKVKASKEGQLLG